MSQSDPETTDAGYPSEWGEPQSLTVTWFHSERLRAAAAAQLRGIEYLEGVLAGTYPLPPASTCVGLALVSATPGAVALRATPNESWLNEIGSVHGGVMATLLDTAMGMAVISTLESVTQTYTTIELRVSFLKPVPVDGTEIEVRGRTLQVGRRVAFTEASAYGPGERLLASASSSLAAITPVIR